MNRKNAKSYVYLIIILIVFFTCVSIYTIGNSLEDTDELEKADMIVVLMGSIPDRILEAVDLYKEGYSSKIVIVEEHTSRLLEEYKIKTPIGAQVNKSIAIEKGVQEEDISIINGDTLSTQDEAVSIRKYLRDNKEMESIILVTSKYHSFRAKKIFEKAFNSLERDVKVISRPTKYDEFHSDRWWKDREDIEKVIFEIIKLLNFYLIDQFKL